MTQSLQEQFTPESECFGCGPKNPHGLHLKSIVEGDSVVALWKPEAHHHAFPDVLNGGIIGSILDCHCNWTAAWALMQANGESTPPCTVTATYTIALKKPTPMDQALRLVAHCVTINDSKRCAHIEASLYAGDTLCATAHGDFVAVKPNHPAYYKHSET